MKIKEFFKKAYESIVLINDTPHRIAGGVALGVFLGVLPGAGPVASLVLAYIFQVNRAAALAGSLLTNSWFSVITFVFAVKIGALLTGSGWQQIFNDCKNLFDHFHWDRIMDGSTWPILKPLLIGYAAIGIIAGAVTYMCSMIVLTEYHRRKKRSAHQDILSK
jgi:uncharacterized protein (DUF2062 family)